MIGSNFNRSIYLYHGSSLSSSFMVSDNVDNLNLRREGNVEYTLFDTLSNRTLA